MENEEINENKEIQENKQTVNSEDTAPKETERSLVSILALNVKGQLGRITTFFSEHNLNILRLVLSAADKDDKVHRTIAYLEGDRKYVNEMCKELEKVENVLKVTNFQTNDEYIEKELCLVKISSTNPQLQNIVNLVTNIGGRTLIMNDKVSIFKVEENEDLVNKFMNDANAITKEIEICRSGMVAIAINDNIDIINV